MKSRNCMLLVLALIPSAAIAQVKVIRPVQIERPTIAIPQREPSLYVFDRYTLNNRDYLLHYMDDFTGKAHSSEFLSNGIQGMAADKSGNVFAAVYVGPSEPTYIKQMRFPITFTGPLKRATAIATDTQGRIYITDGELGQVFRIDDLSGRNLVTLGTRGSGIGQFLNPSGIAVDRTGKIYIADYGNDRIVRVDDMNGEGWRTYDGAAYATRGLQVAGVKSIAVDSRGRLHYLRPQNGYVVRVDDITGANMVSWGGAAGAAGSGYFLVNPESITLDAQDRIYIADPGAGFVSRIDDMTGKGRVVLFKDDSGTLWKRPSLVTVFYPRADKTVIR